MATRWLALLALVLPTLVGAVPHAAASLVDGAGDDSRWLDEYGANHLVVAGALEPDWPADASPRFQYLAYYPTQLQIHRGDVVFFRTDGFHTVTFGPEGQPREGLLRRDKVEPAVALEHELPSDPSCGTSAEAPPCVLDSTDEFVNSGWKLRPSASFGFQIVAGASVGNGDWMIHCHVQRHSDLGMFTDLGYHCSLPLSAWDRARNSA